MFVGRQPPEGLESAGEVVGDHEICKVYFQLVVVFVVEALTVASLMVRFIRSTWPLVHGWLGLVSRCSISFASQII